jgi:Peptidase family M48
MRNFYARATPWGTVQTGRLFEKLSPEEKEAVLAHERGHVAYGHALTRLKWILTFKAFRHPERYFAMCAKQELEADRWALLEGHGLALARLIARFKDGGLGYPTKRERLARLV